MTCVVFFGDIEFFVEKCLCKLSLIFYEGCMITSSGMYTGQGVCDVSWSVYARTGV